MTIGLSHENLKVQIYYSRLFDREVDKQDPSVTPDMVEKLLDILPQIQEHWDRSGTSLCAEVVKLTGKEFKMREIMATLFLSKNFSHMSLPLLMNARFLIEDFNQQSLDLFVGLLFHELLHYFVVDYRLHIQSDLLKKKGPFPKLITTHLHLFALEKRVYESLAKQEQLSLIQSHEKAEIEDYKKAWDLVLDKPTEKQLWLEITS